MIPKSLFNANNPTKDFVGLLLFSYKALCHCVEHGCETALLSCCIIRVNNTFGSSLVSLLNYHSVKYGSSFLVTACNSRFILLDESLESRLEHSVSEILGLGSNNSLLGGIKLNLLFVCQIVHLLIQGSNSNTYLYYHVWKQKAIPF